MGSLLTLAMQKNKYDQDIVKFKAQLHSYGLRLKEITGDGNCLFRAIADQLEGNEKLHRKYRADAVEFISQNKESFAPFIEDDETIDQYLADIEKDAIWGGQIEIQALSTRHQFNIVVHQVDNPSMAFSNFPWGTVPTIHISYHMGEHYNSVRLVDDVEEGIPAKPIGHELKVINKQEDLVEEKKQQVIEDLGLIINGDGNGHSDIPSRSQIIQYACQITGCQDIGIMEAALIECFGIDEIVTYDNIEDTTMPIVSIYEEFEMKKITERTANLCLEKPDNKEEEVKEVVLNTDNDCSNGEESEIQKKMTLLSRDNMIINEQGEFKQMPPKNKKCPCDSKKVYKKCCLQRDEARKKDFLENGTKEKEKEEKQKVLSKEPSFILL